MFMMDKTEFVLTSNFLIIHYIVFKTAQYFWKILTGIRLRRIVFYFGMEIRRQMKGVWNWKRGAPTLILLTFTRNDFKISEFTFIRKDYKNIYLSMSSVKIENSTLSLYIDDIGNRGPTKKEIQNAEVD